MLCFSALVAGSFSLGALVANQIAPAAMNAGRFLIAGAILAAVLAVRGGFRRGDFAAPWRFLVLGGLFAVYFVLMFEGLKTATPVSAAAVFTLMPILTAGFGWLLLRQHTTPRMALALAIGAAGALWVIFRADLSLLLSAGIGAGEIIYFWGCVAHALYIPMVKKLNRGESALAFSFGTLVAGFGVLLFWGWGDIARTDWANLPALVWVTMLYVAIFASAATFVLLQYAALRLPSAKVIAYTFLTSSWVILWELALGHGAPRPLVAVGVLMTGVALALLLKDEGARTGQAAPAHRPGNAQP